MKYVLNGKIYNTDTACCICVGKMLCGSNYNQFYRSPVELYQTKKGNYFVVYLNDRHAEAITENRAKKIMQEYAYEEYIALFSELEEA